MWDRLIKYRGSSLIVVLWEINAHKVRISSNKVEDAPALNVILYTRSAGTSESRQHSGGRQRASRHGQRGTWRGYGLEFGVVWWFLSAYLRALRDGQGPGGGWTKNGGSLAGCQPRGCVCFEMLDPLTQFCLFWKWMLGFHGFVLQDCCPAWHRWWCRCWIYIYMKYLFQIKVYIILTLSDKNK